MKKFLLLLGLLMCAVIGYAIDFKEVKKEIKTEFIKITEDLLATDALRVAVIDELNAMRESEIQKDWLLEQGAQKWANQLEANFEHDVSQTSGRFGGEAILFYQGRFSPQRVVGELMNSPQHRTLLLNQSYNRIGVGIRRVGKDNYVVIRLE